MYGNYVTPTEIASPKMVNKLIFFFKNESNNATRFIY